MEEEDGKFLEVCESMFSLFVKEVGSTDEKEVKSLREKRSGLRDQVRGSFESTRFVRLAKRLSLTEKELTALVWIMIHGTAFPTSEIVEKRSQMVNLREFAGMSALEFLRFTSKQRDHVKQGIIELDDGFTKDFSEVSIKMPSEVMIALSGGKLNSEQYLTIDNTALSEILMEECGEMIPPDQQQQIEGENKDIDDNDDEPTEDEIQKSIEEEMKKLGLEVLPSSNDFTLTLEEEEDSNIDNNNNNNIEGLLPYESDLEYLSDAFEYVFARIKRYSKDMEDDGIKLDNRNPEAIKRELEARCKRAQARWIKRTQLTKSKGKWLPRLECLAQRISLDEFEKRAVLSLAGAVISQEIRKEAMSRRVGIDVGLILGVLCDGLEEQIRSRRYFYKNATLIREGIVRISDRRFGQGDLMDCNIEIDRRMLDFIVGLETELSEMVDGSSCFLPTVSLSQVVLPKSQKKLVLETIKNFELFTALRGRTGFGDGVSYGNGLVLFFYGPPGTGKTMFANALANHLHKKLLVVNVGTFGRIDSEAFRFLFREAKLQDAIVFFDECEPLFESRDMKSGSVVNIALTEIEKFAGTIIMATNRPADIDNAMHRRITLAVEFNPPSHILREQIWAAHVPKNVNLADDVNLKTIARDYELSGGFIKNAMLQALSLAVGRARRTTALQDENDNSTSEGKKRDNFDTDSERNQQTLSEIENLLSHISITSEDIQLACKLQIRGRLADSSSTSKYEFVNNDEDMEDSRRLLNDIICSVHVKSRLRDLVSFEKARKILTSQWGFGDTESGVSTTAVFVGPSGVGKKASVKAISRELGRPIHVIEASEFLRVGISKLSNKIKEKFRDGQNAGAIIVISGAEILLHPDMWKSSASSSHRAVTSQLVSNLSSFSGVSVLLVTTQNDSSSEFELDSLPVQLQHILRVVVKFESPDESQRAELWQKLFPKQTPVDTTSITKHAILSISQKFVSFVARDIKRAILDAAARAAMRPESERFVRLDDIEWASNRVLTRKTESLRSMRAAAASMFS